MDAATAYNYADSTSITMADKPTTSECHECANRSPKHAFCTWFWHAGWAHDVRVRGRLFK